MSDLIEIFGKPFDASPTQVDPPEMQLRDAIEKAGLCPPFEIVLDGLMHRFDSDEKGGKTGWYVAHGDDIPGGAFGCWRKDIKQDWRANLGRELTPQEIARSQAAIEKAKALRRQELERQHETTRQEVTRIWENAQTASDDHPYLDRKQVRAHGVRIAQDGRLMVPLYDENYKLSSLQYIDGSGGKIYHRGGRVTGCLFALGMPSDTIYIAEGFATAATIREVTGQMVITAFSASNLPLVAGTIREQYGQAQRIVIVADNDHSGVGLAKAHEAAAKHAALVVSPPESGDANDYHNSGQDLMSVLTPEVSDWLVPADEWSQQPAPISWLVKRWLQDNALMMVHGPSGGGKTFIVLDWALRIAGGVQDWRGHKVRPGPVVYLAGEGHHGLRGRVAAWKHYHKVGSLQMWLSKAGCDLNTDVGYQKVAESLRALPTPPKLIVVDTLHRFLLGDENSAQDAKGMLDACANLMQTFNCSVLLVHHTGVAGDAQHRARGSSAWRGALDIEVSIVPAKGDKPIEIIQRKSKDAELAMSHQCELRTVKIPGWFDEDGEPVQSAIVDSVTPVDKIDERLASRKDRFARAWRDNSCPLDDNGRPWLSTTQLREWLMDAEGLAEASAKKETMPGSNGRLINILDEENLVRWYVNGWAVVDPDWSSVLKVTRQGFRRDA
jgi:phage/plasmid primase-like uncharacterized protein